MDGERKEVRKGGSQREGGGVKEQGREGGREEVT